MKPFRVRITNVRPKLRVVAELPSQTDRDLKEVRADFEDTLQQHGGEIVGCAIVLWGRDGASTSSVWMRAANPIPGILVPDFVRNRLLAQKIKGWTIETVNDQWSR